MGLPVTIYRYTDAGAPQLTNGTPSEWMDILKKCLVSGYGTKAGLGWTIEFENAAAYKIAFRNKVAGGGSGGYVQFWSATGANAANTGMNFNTAVSMSALDSFIKPGYGRQIQTLNILRGWEVIGTSRGFYIITHQTNSLLIGLPNSDADVYFIGDIWSEHSTDNGVFTIVSSISSGDTYSASSKGVIYPPNPTLYCRLYAADGGSSSLFYSCSKGDDYSAITLDGNAESLGVNHIMTPFVLTGSRLTNDANGIPQNNSLVMPYCRGVIPGLYRSSFAGYRAENWPKDLILNGETWVLLRSRGFTGYWIKTGVWYD